MLASYCDSNSTLSPSSLSNSSRQLLDPSHQLLDPSHYLRHLKLAIVGQPACGKTALLHSLVSSLPSSSSNVAQQALSSLPPAGTTTIGMNAVHRLPIIKNTTITIFDMGGMPSFLPVHAAFVDSETVFLLVIEETDPETNISQSSGWLEWMAACAPGAHVFFAFSKISPYSCLPSIISNIVDVSASSTFLNLHFHDDCMFDATSILSSSSLPQSPSLLSSETNPLVYNISDILEIICQRVFYHRQKILETVSAGKMDDAATSSENTLCAIADHLVRQYSQGTMPSTYIFSDNLIYDYREFLRGAILKNADFHILAQLLQQTCSFLQWGDGICFSSIKDIGNIFFMKPEQISVLACSLLAPNGNNNGTSNGEISFKHLLLHWKTNVDDFYVHHQETHAPLDISPFYQAMVGLGVASRMDTKDAIFLPSMISRPQTESTNRDRKMLVATTQYLIAFQHPHAVVEFPSFTIPLHNYLQTLLPLVVERMTEFARKLTTPHIAITFDLMDSVHIANQLEFQVQVDTNIRRGILVLERECKGVKIFLRPRFQFGKNTEATEEIVEKEACFLYWLIQTVAFLAHKTLLSIFPGMEESCRREQPRRPRLPEILEEAQEQLDSIPRTDYALVCPHCLSKYIAFFFAESQVVFKDWNDLVGSMTNKKALFDLYLREFRYLEATPTKRYSQSGLKKMAAKNVSSISCPCCETSIALDAMLANAACLKLGPQGFMFDKEKEEKKAKNVENSSKVSTLGASTSAVMTAASIAADAAIKKSGALIGFQATQSLPVSGEENSEKHQEN